MENTTKILIMAAAAAASTVLVHKFADAFIPYRTRKPFSSKLYNLFYGSSSQLLTITIEEYQDQYLNQLFKAVNAYLETTATPKISIVSLSTAVEEDNKILDVFQNVQVEWKLVSAKVGHFDHRRQYANEKLEIRSYELTFHQKHKETVFNSYLPYILEQENPREGRKARKHHISKSSWSWQLDNIFDDSVTFNNLVMDSDLKKQVLNDLNTFMSAKESYRRIGKAWQRRYVLYGSSGTDRLRLITAMANYINYDIYEMDLQVNINFRNLMYDIPRKSVLVIKDIDCIIEQAKQEFKDEQIQLIMSQLFGATDTLWSNCGSERLIILMAEQKEKLDPALLQASHVDYEIKMPWCSIFTVKQLALQYLEVKHHRLFEEIEGLIKDVEVTSEEVLREMVGSPDVEVSLKGLLECLHSKKFKLDEPETSVKS